MSETDFETVFVTAGSSTPYFLDDQPPPFRLNPHFAHWIPDLDLQNSVLVVKPGDKPKLHASRRISSRKPSRFKNNDMLISQPFLIEQGDGHGSRFTRTRWSL